MKVFLKENEFTDSSGTLLYYKLFYQDEEIFSESPFRLDFAGMPSKVNWPFYREELSPSKEKDGQNNTFGMYLPKSKSLPSRPMCVWYAHFIPKPIATFAENTE